MPRPSPYTDKQKAAILEAVKTDRKAGKKWPEIHTAATEAGFKSGLEYLKQFAHKGGAVRRRGKSSVVAAAAATMAKRKPGRPKAVAVAGNGAELAGIKGIIEQMVEQRVRATVARAVKALEAAVGKLRGVVERG